MPVFSLFTYIGSEDDKVIMIGTKSYELAKTAILYDANGNVVAVGATDVMSALTKGDVVSKFAEKNGVISSITAKALKSVEADLDAAKTAVEGTTYTLTNDATADSAKTTVEGVVNGLDAVKDKGIAATVTGTFIPSTSAEGETAAKEGSYKFTVTLAKAGQTVTTDEITAVVPAE